MHACKVTTRDDVGCLQHHACMSADGRRTDCADCGVERDTTR
jgi:hypothetical protein